MERNQVSPEMFIECLLSGDFRPLYDAIIMQPIEIPDDFILPSQISFGNLAVDAPICCSFALFKSIERRVADRTVRYHLKDGWMEIK